MAGSESAVCCKELIGLLSQKSAGEGRVQAGLDPAPFPSVSSRQTHFFPLSRELASRSHLRQSCQLLPGLHPCWFMPAREEHFCPSKCWIHCAWSGLGHVSTPEQPPWPGVWVVLSDSSSSRS